MKVSSYKYSLSHNDRYSILIAERINNIYNYVNVILDNRNSFILSEMQDRLLNYYRTV